MIKILLACSAGMSTSLLEKSIRDCAKKRQIEVEVIALSSGLAKDVIDKYDIVLLGPQVSFMLNEFKKMAGEIPVVVIPPQVYAMAKGDECLNLAIESVKK